MAASLTFGSGSVVAISTRSSTSNWTVYCEVEIALPRSLTEKKLSMELISVSPALTISVGDSVGADSSDPNGFSSLIFVHRGYTRPLGRSPRWHRPRGRRARGGLLRGVGLDSWAVVAAPRT